MLPRLLLVTILMVALLLPSTSRSQDALSPDRVFDPETLVEFNFTNRDIADVIQHLVELTGWSIFYDPAHVTGTVTILTPGRVPLAQALRLLQGVMHTRGHAIRVLTPDSSQPVPLATVLAEYAPASTRRDVVVWRNSDARGPKSRPYDCNPRSSADSLPPFWVDVTVDPNR